MKRTNQFLDYAATHPDEILTYTPIDMALEVHSDASYLSETNARSCAEGRLFLSVDTRNTTNNWSVINISHIIKSVMNSSAEAELGALFINAQEAVPQKHK